MFKIIKKFLTFREKHTPGKSLQNRFSPRFRIYMQKAISTPIQGPRSKIMSEKNFDQKSRVSVPLNRNWSSGKSHKESCGSAVSIWMEYRTALCCGSTVVEVDYRFIFDCTVPVLAHTGTRKFTGTDIIKRVKSFILNCTVPVPATTLNTGQYQFCRQN